MREHKHEKVTQESGVKQSRMTENSFGLLYFGWFKELIKGYEPNENGSNQLAHKTYSKHTQTLCCLPARARGQQ